MKFLTLLSGKKKARSKSHLKNLVELANIDGHFDPRESTVLTEIAKRENISSSLISKIAKESGKIELEIPLEEELKFKQFYDLVKMMLADDFIHELEMQLIRHWGMKFGYSKKHLDELIDSLIQNIQNGNDASSARERVYWMIKQDNQEK